jgi:hypothetical protein
MPMEGLVMRRWIALALLLAACVPSARSDTGSVSCTRVLGFSVTMNWYEADGTPTESGFERIIGEPDAWELMAAQGQGIADWGPGGSGWNSPVTYASCSDSPDRIVLQVATSEAESNAEVLSELRAAVAETHRRFPNAQLDLMPMPGGPGCGTFAESIHDQMLHEIRQVTNGTDTLEGPDTHTTACSQYRDDRGHLTVPGAVVIATQVAKFYRGTA